MRSAASGTCSFNHCSDTESCVFQLKETCLILLLVLPVLQETSLSQLRRGMKHLGNELSERTGQLKQLIKNNFERCIRCALRVHTYLSWSTFLWFTLLHTQPYMDTRCSSFWLRVVMSPNPASKVADAPIPSPSSCKGTIDDIYLKLRKIQLDKQGGTVTLQRAVEQVWNDAMVWKC